MEIVLRRVHKTWWRMLARVASAGSLFLLLVLPNGCHQQSEYPNRPIVLICPWTAGGGTDQVSRQMAALLEQEMGVPVNVVNAIGGAGVTGHTRGALARPDGYTLTMITVELNMLHWRGLTSISHEDYRPLVLLNQDAAALFVRSDSPWKSLDELQEHIRANRGEMKASGTAQGGIWHLALAGWLKSVELSPGDVTWLSINGAAPSLQELIAGGVDLVCCSLPEAKPLLDSGRVRCLGVMAEERLAQFPSVQTFKEQGLDWSMGGWRGVAVPAGTPDAVAREIGEALEKVVRGEEFREYMDRAGFNWSFEGPEGFRTSLIELDEEFGELLTSKEFQGMGRGPIGPMVFPGLLGVAGLGLFIGLLLTRGFAKDGAAEISHGGMMRIAGVVGWLFAYLVLAEVAGFILTVVFLLSVLMWRMGVHWIISLATSLAVAPALYQVFAIYLRVPLPIGWLGW